MKYLQDTESIDQIFLSFHAPRYRGEEARAMNQIAVVLVEIIINEACVGFMKSGLQGSGAWTPPAVVSSDVPSVR